MKDILINGRYRVDYKIGQGGCGLVYAGTDMESKQEVAIKLMHYKDEPKLLSEEAVIYRSLSGGPGIPRVIWSGYEGDYAVMVHEILGPSLEDLLNYCNRKFSLKTLLLVADQAIRRIEYIHNKGVLHGDIKPDNFLKGIGLKGNILYLIDFGLASEFDGTERDSLRHGYAFKGTRRYASLNTHKGYEQSWCDDLESLLYVLIYCAKGSLPWQNLKATDDAQKDRLITDMKSRLSAEELCTGLPSEFGIYMHYVRSLGVKKPDYHYLRKLFRDLFRARGYRNDNVYDWTEKLFLEQLDGREARLGDSDDM